MEISYTLRSILLASSRAPDEIWTVGHPGLFSVFKSHRLRESLERDVADNFASGSAWSGR